MTARKKLLHIFITILLITIIIPSVKAQWISQQQLSEKMQLFNIVTPSITLFVHFDKTIYTNNETAWFTGYLLKAGMAEIAKHNILSVALIRDRDSTVVKSDKYLISNGISFGSMLLPDSMITGNYHFQVTTNRVSKGKPDVVFIQSVVIKTNIGPAFNASIKLLKPGITTKQPNKLLVSVTTRDNRLLAKPAEITYSYGHLFKKSTTNATGELVFDIPPQPEITDPNVYVTVKSENASSFLTLPLLKIIKKAKVSFYPEGGNLIVGVLGKMVFTVKDEQNGLVATKAKLFKDNIEIATIETDSYGVGQFLLSPDKNSNYTIKLAHSGFIDSIYNLPTPLQSGVGIMVNNGAVKDTLILKLNCVNPQKIALRLHDFVSTSFYKEYQLTNIGETVKIPVRGISKGLKAITVFDSIGKPLAERMVFTNYDPRRKVDITTDQKIYGQRQKVTVQLKLNHTDTIGMVSIACVQGNRISGALNNDIESYVYLKHELNELPMAMNGIGYEDKNYVEDMLLTKGWRRYNWTDILKTTIKDTLKVYDTLAIKINVQKFNKLVKRVVQLAIFQGKHTWINTTNSLGEVELKNDQLITEYGKKPMVAAIGKGQQNLTMKVIDPYEQLNKNYIRLFTPQVNTIPSTIQNNNELLLKSNESVIRLKEVKITSGKGDGISYIPGKNACGDYVCIHGFLNCPAHPNDPGNKQPIKGHEYGVLEYIGGKWESHKEIYQGCKEPEFMKPIQGIYTKKEFYINEYKEPAETALISTIYWNHGALIGSKDKVFEFYTSDITGNFKIIVQGITDNDLLYGQEFFEVKSNEVKK